MNQCWMALLLLPVTAPSLRADPEIGSTREAVVAELGEPRSRMAVGEFEQMTYSRGTITLENNVVTKLSLLSEAEWARRENRRVEDIRAQSETRRHEAVRLAELRREDNAALARMIAAPEWAAASPAERIVLLDRLAATHPYADTGTLRAAAELRVDRDNDRRLRLAALETRATEAESRAGEAETRARIAENNAAYASASAENARRAAEEARRRADSTPAVTGIVSTVVVGGRYGYGYDRYRNGTPVSVASDGTLVTNGNVTLVRPSPYDIVRPAPPVVVTPVRPTPQTVPAQPPWAAHRDIPKSGPPSSQKR